ncbi:MAG TPA: hypothetical protein VND45_11210, partial [Thermoanaerobaculia bacterium]|nr:hypothetical protein [Thermoanaerobaculia bacterium]
RPPLHSMACVIPSRCSNAEDGTFPTCRSPSFNILRAKSNPLDPIRTHSEIRRVIQPIESMN